MLTVEAVKAHLNEISWEEFVGWRIAEKYPDTEERASANREEIQALLRQLATQISVGILDHLEEEGDYLKWVLRLSPFVKDENSYDRAKRALSSKDNQIRYWAQRLMEDILPD